MWSDLGHFGINFVTKRNAVCSSCFSSVCRFTPDRESIESLSLVGTTHHVFFLNNCMLDTLQQMNQVDTSTHTHSTLVKLSHQLGASLAVPLSKFQHVPPPRPRLDPTPTDVDRQLDRSFVGFPVAEESLLGPRRIGASPSVSPSRRGGRCLGGEAVRGLRARKG